ncbi:unnamed protein product [marine sediment metagenome]|uniref:Uncharacterized protein n=1 Tax=marine sediment metagenome TaxID=412755 RepID=X1TCA7_9ZZZZ
MHNCPLCGEKTFGTISEGGIHFGVCEECYQGRYQEKEEERREEVKHCLEEY